MHRDVLPIVQACYVAFTSAAQKAETSEISRGSKEDVSHAGTSSHFEIEALKADVSLIRR
jgi:hypothetical protein